MSEYPKNRLGPHWNNGSGDGSFPFPFPHSPTEPAHPQPGQPPHPGHYPMPGQPPNPGQAPLPSDFLPHPQPLPPQMQPAPPDPPDETGGGGDGDGDGDGWFFPPQPPYNPSEPPYPYVVRDITSAMPDHAMYVLVTVPWYAPGQIANLTTFGAPPPALVSYWIYPVHYVETQVRQYFHPKGPFQTRPEGMGVPIDCDETYYRELGWIASPPKIERYPVFSLGLAGWLVPYDCTLLDTQVSDWQLVTVNRYSPDSAIDVVNDRLQEIRDNHWLNPKWLSGINEATKILGLSPDVCDTAELYVKARGTNVVPLVCATPDWEPDI